MRGAKHSFDVIISFFVQSEHFQVFWRTYDKLYIYSRTKGCYESTILRSFAKSLGQWLLIFSIIAASHLACYFLRGKRGAYAPLFLHDLHCNIPHYFCPVWTFLGFLTHSNQRNTLPPLHHSLTILLRQYWCTNHYGDFESIDYGLYKERRWITHNTTKKLKKGGSIERHSKRMTYRCLIDSK